MSRLSKCRPFVSNAAELRCECLFLVVYVAGVVLLSEDDTSTIDKSIRVVAYDHKNLKPTSVQYAKTPEELLKALQKVLAATYNRLSRHWNLAGLTSEMLALKPVAGQPIEVPAIPFVSINRKD